MSIFTRVRDLIGSGSRRWTMRINTRLTHLNTRDVSTPDYAYWDKARRAQVKGMELSGLLLKPLGSKITAWVMGQPPDWRMDDEYTQDKMQEWWNKNNNNILRVYEESVNLGDCYVVVNPDLTLTVVPPHVVTPIYANDDFTQRIGWKIQETYPNPNQPSDKMEVTDEYTLAWRTRTIRKEGIVVSTKRWRNVTKKLPIVHVANILGSDEEFGTPEGAALVPAMQRYGDIFDTALKGNIRQGRPTPVIEKMGTADQVRKFWEKFGRRENHTMPDGTTETVDVIDFDPDQLLTLGGDASFKYAAPGEFGKDAQMILELLFYLILQHSEIPEFVWGNAIGSSKASAEAQKEPFLKWLEKKRGMAQNWMIALAEASLAYMNALDPKMKIGTNAPFYQWRPISDTNADVTLRAVQFAKKEGWVDDVDGLSLLPLDIVNPKETAARGRKFKEQSALDAAKLQKQINVILPPATPQAGASPPPAIVPKTPKSKKASGNESSQ